MQIAARIARNAVLFTVLTYLLFTTYSIVFMHIAIVPGIGVRLLNIHSHQVVLLGPHEYYLADVISNVYNNLDYGDVVAIRPYATNSTFLSSIKESFVYDSSRAKSGKIAKSLPPASMLQRHSGVCGDFAFLYAAYFLNREGSATLVFITAPGWSAGHMFEVNDNIAHDITVFEPFSTHLTYLLITLPRATIAEIKLTMVSTNVFIYSITIMEITNLKTITVPAYLGGIVTIVCCARTKTASFPAIRIVPTSYSDGVILFYGLMAKIHSNTIVIFRSKSSPATLILSTYSFTTYYLSPTTVYYQLAVANHRL